MLQQHETSVDSAKLTMIASKLKGDIKMDLNDLITDSQEENEVDNPFDTNKENNNNLLNSATFNMSIVSKKPQEVAVLQKPKNSQMPVKTVFN